jgi:hypothetical protein
MADRASSLRTGAALALAAILTTAAAATTGVAPTQKPAELKLTQKYLVPLCLDGASVKSGQRSWKLSAAQHTMAFTMRNTPRKGTVATPASAGIAVITFAVEASHVYEVEARAGSTTFSSRVWERGAWSPVVRDRTADSYVKTEAVWSDGGCQPKP